MKHSYLPIGIHHLVHSFDSQKQNILVRNLSESNIFDCLEDSPVQFCGVFHLLPESIRPISRSKEHGVILSAPILPDPFSPLCDTSTECSFASKPAVKPHCRRSFISLLDYTVGLFPASIQLSGLDIRASGTIRFSR